MWSVFPLVVFGVWSVYALISDVFLHKVSELASLFVLWVVSPSFYHFVACTVLWLLSRFGFGADLLIALVFAVFSPMFAVGAIVGFAVACSIGLFWRDVPATPFIAGGALTQAIFVLASAYSHGALVL